MLQVRKVRVEDVKLVPISYPQGASDGECVRLKAESLDHSTTGRSVSRTWPNWASVHMNLGIANAVAPGKELLLAVADKPNQPVSNSFRGAIIGSGNSIARVSANGSVDVPVGGRYAFNIAQPDHNGPDIVVSFEGNHAWEFVQALLWGWLRYDEE